MSDEEDTTILLAGKREDIKITTRVIRQPVTVNGQHVVDTSPRSHITLFMISFVAALGGLAFGYDMGIGTNTVSFIKDSFELSCSEERVIGSTWLIGAMLASLVGGVIVDGCGRRWAICCSAFLLTIGSIMSALANSFPLLLCGRLLGGFACALSIISHCIYAAEMSGANSRAFSVLLYQLGAAVGMLLASIAGSGNDTQWRVVFWFSAVPALLQGFLALFFLPHSPHFKLLQLSQGMQAKHSSTCSSLGNLAETLLLALGLVFLQQISGRSAVLYYAPRAFVLVGVCPETAFMVAAIILNTIKVSSISLSLCIVDKIGRRPALIMGATCMMTTIALLGLLSSLDDNILEPHSLLEPCGNTDIGESVPLLPTGGFHYVAGGPVSSTLLPTGAPPPFPLLPTPVSLVAEDTYAGATPWCSVPVDTSLSPALRYLTLFAVMCYEIAYSFGLGPVTWLLLTEIFPVSVKGRAIAMTTSLHWLADLVTPITAMYVINTFTFGGTFLCHSLVCLVAVVFIFLFIPETRGKSLHQIAQGLKNVSSKTRMYQNLQGLPCLTKNTWLQQKSQQYRQVSHATVESTII